MSVASKLRQLCRNQVRKRKLQKNASLSLLWHKLSYDFHFSLSSDTKITTLVAVETCLDTNATPILDKTLCFLFFSFFSLTLPPIWTTFLRTSNLKRLLIESFSTFWSWNCIKWEDQHLLSSIDYFQTDIFAKLDIEDVIMYINAWKMSCRLMLFSTSGFQCRIFFCWISKFWQPSRFQNTFQSSSGSNFQTFWCNFREIIFFCPKMT